VPVKEVSRTAEGFCRGSLTRLGTLAASVEALLLLARSP
jgi:hypothetical protein